MTEKQFTLSELSRITGMSRVTLRKWCGKGKLSFITDGDRMLIPMSEVWRVFPNMTAEDIQNGTNPAPKNLPSNMDISNKTGGHGVQNAELEAMRARVMELENLVRDQKAELDKLRFMTDILQKQVDSLTEDKRTLNGQLATKDEQFALFGRLISERSSAPRKGNGQPKGPDGKFISRNRMEGQGAAALLQQTSLIDVSE